MQEKTLYEQFAEVMDKTGIEMLYEPKLFVSCFKDFAEGKVYNQKMLIPILEEVALPAFSSLNRWTESSIDDASEKLSADIRKAYTISEEWADEIAYSLGAAVKKARHIPVDEKAIVPGTSSQNALKEPEKDPVKKPETEMISDDAPPEENRKKWKLRPGVRTALLALAVLMAIPAVVLFLHPWDKNTPSVPDTQMESQVGNENSSEAVSMQDSTPVSGEENASVDASGQNQNAEGSAGTGSGNGIHFQYADIIAQYQRMASLGYTNEAFAPKLESDYYDYCYVTGMPFFFAAKSKDPYQTVGYCILDINADGVDELIICSDMGGIYDVFTKDQKGNAVSLFGHFYDSQMNPVDGPKEGCSYNTGLGYKKTVSIRNDGTLVYRERGGWSGVIEYSLPAHGTKLKVKYGVQSENGHYYQLLYDGSEVEISEEDFNNFVGPFLDNYDEDMELNPTMLTA